MIFVFVLFFLVVEQKMTLANEQKSIEVSKQFSNLIINEIKLADSVVTGYYREFTLPPTLNGYNYSADLLITSIGTEVVIKYNNIEQVTFLEPYVNGTLGKGKNRIFKPASMIYVANEKAVCGDHVIESPNFYGFFEECEYNSDCHYPPNLQCNSCICGLPT